MLLLVQSVFLLIAVCCAADEPTEQLGDLLSPLKDFKDLQSYLDFIKSMSSDPSVSSFLKESQPDIDIYNHVKAVMEEYAAERNHDIKYKSSAIVYQPNYPKVVNVYILKDGETFTCELVIDEKATFTDFQDFTLKCLGGEEFKRTKAASTGN